MARIKINDSVKLFRKIERLLVGQTNGTVHRTVATLVATSVERALEFSRVSKTQRDIAGQLAHDGYMHLIEDAANQRPETLDYRNYRHFKHTAYTASSLGLQDIKEPH